MKNIVILLCLTIMVLWAAILPPDGWRCAIPIVQQPNAQTEPDVVAKGDSVFIAWMDARTTPAKVYFRYSSDKGFTWQTEVLISGSDTVYRHLNIAIAKNSPMTYLLWTSGPTSSKYALKFARSTNRGQTWQPVQTLASGLDREPCGSVYVDGNGYIHIGYYKRIGTSYNLMYAKSTNQGQSFANETVYNTGAYDIFGTSITTTVFNNYQPHIVFLRDDNGHAYFRHTYRSAGSWVSPQIIDNCVTNDDVYYTLDMVSDQNDSLHFCFQGYYSIFNTATICYIQANYTAVTGWTWRNTLDTLHLETGSQHPSIAIYGSNLQVVWQSYGIYGKLHYSLSTNLGDTWVEWSGQRSQLLWRNNPYQSPYYCFLPAISAGANERHVVFNSFNITTQEKDIYHLANDDLLLSDDQKATAYNGGRHLIRDPLNNRLHLVYFSQDRPHYTYSTDNGSTWTPYHIIENTMYGSDTPKDFGYYPTVGLVPGVSNRQPCVVYIKNDSVIYRYYNESQSIWTGRTIFPYWSGEKSGSPSPPSVVTYNNDVYLTFSVIWYVGESIISAIYFYKFPYNTIYYPHPETLDASSTGSLGNSRVSLTVDGNGNPHCVWEKKTGPNLIKDIFYRWKNGSTWVPPLGQPPCPVSDQPNANSTSPHIDDYGDSLTVVWYYAEDSEIYRRKKKISTDAWLDKENYSLSSPYPSEFPVNAENDFSVWCEQPGIQFDIPYRSDTYGFGWVSQETETEYFCHSQLRRGSPWWYLYTIFTKGNNIPYRIVPVIKRFQYAPPPVADFLLYSVDVGNDTASVFCLHRDTVIQYASHSVDYADTELSYTLPLLEPTFPFHLIKGTVYFEGASNKLYEVWLNGVKKRTLAVPPNQAFDFLVPIPNALYQDTHCVSFSVKSPQASGVYLSGLEVYRLTEEWSGGGPQSSGSSELKNKARFIVTPNPFSKNLDIRYQMPDSRSNPSTSLGTGKQEVFLKIYDATGGLVKNFSRSTPYALRATHITWDGCDDTGKQLPNGIYFLELKSSEKTITEKVILLR